MAFSMIDPPFLSVADVDAWLEELEVMAKARAGDPEALAAIAHEVAQARKRMVVLREMEEAGTPAPPDDRDEPLE